MAEDSKTYDEAFKKFIEDVLAEHSDIKPVAAEAFGGRVKILGRTVSDNRDMNKIRAWAEEGGRKFSDQASWLNAYSECKKSECRKLSKIKVDNFIDRLRKLRSA